MFLKIIENLLKTYGYFTGILWDKIKLRQLVSANVFVGSDINYDQMFCLAQESIDGVY